MNRASSRSRRKKTSLGVRAMGRLLVETPRQRQYRDFLARVDQVPVSLRRLVDFGCQLLRRARVHHHHFEFSSDPLRATAQHLAFHALGLPLDGMCSQYQDFKVSLKQAKSACRLFEKRIATRMPTAYITGKARYLGRTFYVNRHVLVPRSAMTFRLRSYLADAKWRNRRVLDLCTGSGCIGISMALMNPKIQVDLIDVSPEALRVAKTNIKLFSLQGRVRCIQSDLFSKVRGKYDLIVTNPPYVSAEEYEALSPEFIHEPKLALECGPEGLDIVHRIIRVAGKYLNPGGKLFAEVGSAAVEPLVAAYPKLDLHWQPYMRPDGSVTRGSVNCIFWIDSDGLQSVSPDRKELATRPSGRRR